MMPKLLRQEQLKIIACITMLLDHIGAALYPSLTLRIIGRAAFPIYCFLLAEGIHHTKNPSRYGLRLLIGAALSEIPFDLLLFGRLTWDHQSVMVTLLLAFLYGQFQKKLSNPAGKILLIFPFFVIAEMMRTDYGGWGVVLAACYVLTGRESKWLQGALVLLVLWMIGGMQLQIGSFRFPIELFGISAMIPISLYSGRKGTNSAMVQRLFYLFYPAHMVVLLLLKGVV